MISPVLRPKLWAALLGAIAAAVLSTPAYAEPGLPTTVPDTGSRPAVTGALQLPGGAPIAGVPVPPVVNVGTGPLAAAISAGEAQVGALGETLLLTKQKRIDAKAQLDAAGKTLAAAQDALLRAQQAADAAAADAVKAAAALPDSDLAQDIRELNRLQQITRGQKVDGGTTGVAGELSRARSNEQLAYQAHAAAKTRVDSVEAEFTAGEASLRTAEASLLKLRRDNAAQLIEIERQQEAAEQQIGAGYVSNQNISGMAAHPRALAAVRYALAQLGDPYKWSEEGPNQFDCSGLMWAAYRSPGADYFDLPGSPATSTPPPGRGRCRRARCSPATCSSSPPAAVGRRSTTSACTSATARWCRRPPPATSSRSRSSAGPACTRRPGSSARCRDRSCRSRPHRSRRPACRPP